METRPSRHPPAVRNRTEENVPRQPWTKNLENQDLSLKELPVYTMEMVEQLIGNLKHFTQNFLHLNIDDVNSKVLCISKDDLLEDVAQHPVFMNFKKTVEKTGVLIADTECPSQSRLKHLNIPVSAGLGLVEVLQLGDLKGNILIIQILQDCREGHVGCKCPYECSKTYEKQKNGIHTYTSSCPTDRGQHAEWGHRSSLKIHGFQELPEFVREWLNRKSIFVVQSSVACHSGKYEDKERIDRLLGTNTTSWVELQNIHAMFLGTSPTKCDLCQEDLDLGEHRNHVVSQHGVKAYMNKRKCGNGRLFQMFGLQDPVKNFGSEFKIFKMARHEPFSTWPRELLNYDSGDILIVALTLWQVTIDMMKIQGLPSTASVLEYMRYILHILKNEPSLTTLSAKDRVWPFQFFRKRNEMGCIEKLPGKIPAYLPGGPTLDIPYPVRNIRQVVTDMADDQYYPPFRHSNISPKYRIQIYDPIEIAKATRRFMSDWLDANENGKRIDFNDISNTISRSKLACLNKEQCFYGLCDSKALHNIKLCPTLHHLCQACGTRGHQEDNHKTYTPIELKNIFDLYCSWGLYTCLPLLCHVEEFKHTLNEFHLSFGYFGDSGIKDYGPMNAYFFKNAGAKCLE